MAIASSKFWARKSKVRGAQAASLRSPDSRFRAWG